MTDGNWTPATVGPGRAEAVENTTSQDGTPAGTKRRAEQARGGLTAVALAAGGMAFLSSGANAQGATDVPAGYQPASDVENVASIHVQADGSVELIMENGQSILIAAGDVLVEDGVVYLTDVSVYEAMQASIVAPAASGGGAGLGIAGALAAGGGVAALAVGGGGGGSSSPAPTPNANPPVFTSGSSVAVDENGSGTVYTATATDADGNSISYSIVGGADSAGFSINRSTGALSFVGSPDFENPGDANGDNAYIVTIRASDGTNTADQTVTVSVNDVNEAPVFSSAGAASVAENQTAAYTAVAADDEGTALTYSLSGVDAALFSIDASSGLVTFKSAPDYENPADPGGDNVYDIVVRASDGTNITNQAVAVSVTDQNDNAPVFTSGTSISVAENQTAAFTAVATDADSGSTITYSLSGADASAFKIDAASGVVTFVTAPDYESPGDQLFALVVTASDGANTTDQSVTVSVTNVNEAPVFTSAATTSVQENQTAAYTAVASDPDLTSPAYSISGGADAALFNINAVTGEVTFKAAPNFEVPADAGGNNVYNIVVRAADGTNNTDQAVAISVTDVNDNTPVFSSGATASIVEGTLTAYDADASDADVSDTLSYSISGTDAALFNINGSTGVVTFKVAPDFELPTDSGGNNVYDFTVTASDGTNSADRTVAVTVTNGNENAPVFTSPNTASVPENGTAAYTATATDIDLDTITYSISGGADAARFSINASSGVVTFVSAPDHENPADAGGIISTILSSARRMAAIILTRPWPFL
jgi:VCBS repeat-containing protein